MKYEDLCALVEESINGLTIKNCEKIEEITLPRLENLHVKNCANLHTIHCRVDTKIWLEELPKFTTLDLMQFKVSDDLIVDPYVQEVMAYYCPKFLMPAKSCFSKLYYEEGCTLAHEKYGKADTTTDVIIERNYNVFSVTVSGIPWKTYTLENL